MNAKQIAKLKMSKLIENHCTENTSILGENIAFQANTVKLKAKNDAAAETAQRAELALKGIAAGKTVQKKDMCGLVADTAGIVFTFAIDTANEALKAEVDYSLSALLKMKDSLLILRCRNILDRAVENKRTLVDYGVTDRMLTDLQTIVTNYAETIPKPGAAKGSRKTLNSNLIQILKEIDAILLSMDKQIVTFKTAHPDFVQTYFNLREIPDPQTTVTQLKGVVTASPDEKPIKNALVTVVEPGKTAKTKSTGEYSFKPIPHGKFTVRITAEGFADFEKDEVEIKLGAVNNLNTTMQPV